MASVRVRGTAARGPRLASITATPGAFDIVHTHQAPSLALASIAPAIRTVYTIHHCRDERLIELYGDFPNAAYVGISKRQAELVPEVPVEEIILHGLDPDLYEAGRGDGGYIAFLGRFAREKGPHFAIDAARRAGVPLRMGGGVHPPDKAFFEQEVRPRLHGGPGGVEWLGELSHQPKLSLLGGAKAMLFPIDWEEPFGLVMIEAMLVGTPVIAFARGSVPEVVEDGITGFVVRDVAEMAERIRQLGTFNRARCRARAQEKWSSLRMAREHENPLRTPPDAVDPQPAPVGRARGEPLDPPPDRRQHRVKPTRHPRTRAGLTRGRARGHQPERCRDPVSSAERSGIENENTLPFPTVLSTQMRPPWPLTIALAIVSPRPSPCPFGFWPL